MYDVVVNFSGNLIFVGFVSFLMHDNYKVLYTHMVFKV